LAVAVLAAAILREAFTLQKRAGFVLIATGVVGIVSVSGATIGSSQNIGHLLFLASAFAFACYTVAMRRACLEGISRRRHLRSRLDADLLAAVRSGGRGRHLRCPAERYCASSACAGSPDGGLLVCRLRTGGQHFGRFQRSGFRRLMPRDDGPHGHPDPWRVAIGCRLGRNHAHLRRRLCRQWRTNATMAPFTAAVGRHPLPPPAGARSPGTSAPGLPSSRVNTRR
jgi:hypothetical protein